MMNDIERQLLLISLKRGQSSKNLKIKLSAKKLFVGEDEVIINHTRLTNKPLSACVRSIQVGDRVPCD